METVRRTDERFRPAHMDSASLVDWSEAMVVLDEMESADVAAASRVVPHGFVQAHEWVDKEFDFYLVHRVDECRDVALQVLNGLVALGHIPYLERLGLESAELSRPAIERAVTCVILLTSQLFESYWCAVELIAAVELHAQGAIKLLLLPVQGERWYPDAAALRGETVDFPTGAMVMKNYGVWFPELAQSTRDRISRLFGGGAYTESRTLRHSRHHYTAFERTLVARMGINIPTRNAANDLLAAAPPSALADPELIEAATEIVRSVDEANCLQSKLGAPARYFVHEGRTVAPEERARHFLDDARKLNIVQTYDAPTVVRVASRLDLPSAGERPSPLRYLHVAEVIEVKEKGDGIAMPYEVVRQIEVHDFARIVRLLRMRAAEHHKSGTQEALPQGAPEELIQWAVLDEELPTKQSLRAARLDVQMHEPIVACAKMVLSYIQVSGSLLQTFPLTTVGWPAAVVSVLDTFAWFNVEKIFDRELFVAFAFLRFVDKEKVRDQRGGVPTMPPPAAPHATRPHATRPPRLPAARRSAAHMPIGRLSPRSSCIHLAFARLGPPTARGPGSTQAHSLTGARTRLSRPLCAGSPILCRSSTLPTPRSATCFRSRRPLRRS